LDEIATRLKELGFNTPAPPLPHPQEDDLRILSHDLDGQAPWLNPDSTVSIVHLIRAADAVGHSLDEIATRLKELGFNTPAPPLPHPQEDDLRILSRDLDGQAPWLDPDKPAHPAHILRAADRTASTIDHIKARLTALGHHVPATRVPDLGRDDLRILSSDLDGQTPWLDHDKPVHPAHIVQAADRTENTIDHVKARLTALGHHVPAAHVPLPEPEDLPLVSADLNARAPWLDHDDPVQPTHVLQASRVTARTPHAIVTRLTELGYRLPDSITLSPEAHASQSPATAPAEPVPDGPVRTGKSP
ncbi:hypothetical protein ACH5A7_06925, partial [Streptomyces sp. NPDC018955]|uniref:wHTH domain-containing protein n=1 Tax=Streptomyces sp. NPDC018955 TaxID=3365055 RepID=UPI0037A87BE6